MCPHISSKTVDEPPILVAAPVYLTAQRTVVILLLIDEVSSAIFCGLCS